MNTFQVEDDDAEQIGQVEHDTVLCKFLTMNMFESLCATNHAMNDAFTTLQSIVKECKHRYFDVFIPQQQIKMNELKSQQHKLSDAISNAVNPENSCNGGDVASKSQKLQSLSELTHTVVEYRKQLDTVMNTIKLFSIQAEEQHEEIFKPFHEQIGLLETLLPKDKRLPSEITYFLIRTPEDEANNSVTFECGDITDKDGKSIFLISCYLCNRIIQHSGVRHPRWTACNSEVYLCPHCLPLKEYCITSLKEFVSDESELIQIQQNVIKQHKLSCCDIIVEQQQIEIDFEFEIENNSTVNKLTEFPTIISPWRTSRISDHYCNTIVGNQTELISPLVMKWLSVLEELDPFWYECFFVEFNHKIWLRDFPRDSMKNLTLGLIDNYRFRPAVNEPARQHIYHANEDRLPPTTWFSLDWISRKVFSLQNFIQNQLKMNNSSCMSDSRSFIVIIARPSIEWLFVDMVGSICGIPIAAAHCNWRASDLDDSIELLLQSNGHNEDNKIAMAATHIFFFCEEIYLEQVLTSKIIRNTSQTVLHTSVVPTIIIWDHDHKIIKTANSVENAVQLISMDDVFLGSVEREDNVVTEDDPKCTTEDDSALHMIMYTSGSTGKPKAAMISSNTWIKIITKTSSFYKPLSLVLHCPLYLMGERLGMWSTLCNGGSCGIVASMTDFDYGLQVVRPTMFTATPKLWYHYFSKLRNLERSSIEYSKEVMNIRERLGGRVHFAGTGGAPSGSNLLDMLEDCFGENDSFENSFGGDVTSAAKQGQVGHNYGCTEVGNIAMNGVIDPDVQVYIEPVPGLTSSYAENADVASPVVGQICVKTKTMFSGYLGVDNSTIFTDNGFYRTGDLGYLLPERHIVIVGRCKTTIKMMDGTFFNPESAERQFMQLFDQTGGLELEFTDVRSWVGSVVVGVVSHSSPLWNSDDDRSNSPANDCIYAVIFLDSVDEVEGNFVNIDSPRFLPPNSKIFQNITQAMKLSHKPSLMLIEPPNKAPTVENGLATVSGKISRTAFVEKYNPLAVSMMKSIAVTPADTLSSVIEDHEGTRDIYDIVLLALRACPLSSFSPLNSIVFGSSGDRESDLEQKKKGFQQYCEENPSIQLPQIGFDSLTISMISSSVFEYLQKLLSPSMKKVWTKSKLFEDLMSSPLKIVIDNLLNEDDKALKSPKPCDGQLLQCEEDIKLYSKYLSQALKTIQDNYNTDKPIEVNGGNRVEYTKELLLTGATGYVGSNFLVQWISRKLKLIKSTDSKSTAFDVDYCDKIVCIVRCESKSFSGVNSNNSPQSTAMERLVQSVKNHVSAQSLNAEKLLQYAIDQQILTVLVGNIASEHFGLSLTEYHRLINNVHFIVHAAAEVKMFGTYETLRATNVIGTFHCLQLYVKSLENVYRHQHSSVIKERSISSAPTMLHISTVSTIPCPLSHDVSSMTFTLNDANSYLPFLHDGYAQSKCVAEILVYHVMKALKELISSYTNGLHVMRLGYIGWARSKVLLRSEFLLPSNNVPLLKPTEFGEVILGEGNRSDWFCRLLESCYLEKCAPFFEPKVMSQYCLSILPVDDMVERFNFVLHPENEYFRLKHYISHGLGHQRFEVQKLFQEAARVGASYSGLDGDVTLPSTLWCDHMLRRVDKRSDHPLFPIFSMIQSSRNSFLNNLVDSNGLASFLLAHDPLCSHESMDNQFQDPFIFLQHNYIFCAENQFQ